MCVVCNVCCLLTEHFLLWITWRGIHSLSKPSVFTCPASLLSPPVSMMPASAAFTFTLLILHLTHFGSALLAHLAIDVGRLLIHKFKCPWTSLFFLAPCNMARFYFFCDFDFLHLTLSLLCLDSCWFFLWSQHSVFDLWSTPAFTSSRACWPSSLSSHIPSNKQLYLMQLMR